jgi:hypothetical protein
VTQELFGVANIALRPSSALCHRRRAKRVVVDLEVVNIDEQRGQLGAEAVAQIGLIEQLDQLRAVEETRE